MENYLLFFIIYLTTITNARKLKGIMFSALDLTISAASQILRFSSSS